MTLTFCDQNGYVQQDASQHASGVKTIQNLLSGSAEFSTGGYAFCFVTLTNVSDYSWCGIYVTKLELHGGDRLHLHSGSGYFVEMTQATHENKYYILHLEAGAFDLIQFAFTRASSNVGYKSRSNIDFSYQGTCHNFRNMFPLMNV